MMGIATFYEYSLRNREVKKKTLLEFWPKYNYVRRKFT